MRSIKLSFEHPDYLYPFRLTLSATNDLDRLNYRQADEAVHRLRSEAILTQEEQKILASLSVAFRAELGKEYQKRLNERRSADYMGCSEQEHYAYFAEMCRGSVTVREMVELRHYLLRSIANLGSEKQSNLELQRWVGLCLLFFTNMTKGHSLLQVDSSHTQFTSFLSLFILVELLNSLITADSHTQLTLSKLLPQMMDTILRSYVQLHHHQFQEQVLLGLVGLARTVIAHIKAEIVKKQEGEKEKEGNQDSAGGGVSGGVSGGGGKKAVESCIYWVINFTPHQKFNSKVDILAQTNTPYTLLQIALKSLSRTNSIAVAEQVLNFLKLLFDEVSVFGQLLFLITEAIRFEFPKLLTLLSEKIKQREFRSSQVLRYVLQIDLGELQGKTLEPFKLKEMVRTQKVGEKSFNNGVREVNRAVGHFLEEFGRYKKGKVVFRRRREVGGVSEEEIEEREILNIERLAEQSHLHLKSHEILSMELYRENEELIKVNRWLEEKLRKQEAVIAELLSINSKGNIQAKLALISVVVSQKIQSVAPYVGGNPTITINGNQKLGIHGQGSLHHAADVVSRRHTPDNPLLQPHEASHMSSSGMHRNGSLKDLMQTITHKSIREDSRKNIPVISLNHSNSETILVEIPKIDMSKSRNSVSAKQQELNLSSIIFQEATSMINKTLEMSEKHAGQGSLLPPPLPPPPPFMTNMSNANEIPSLLPPPPPLLPPLPPPPPFSMGMPSFLPPPPPLLPPPPLFDRKSNNPFPKQPTKDSNLPQKIEMKNIGWNMLQSSKLKNTFWESLTSNPIHLDEEEVVKYFSKVDNKKPFVPAQSAQPERKTILKPDRIKNIEIVLKKMKLNENTFVLIEDSLRTYDENYLNEEFLIGLLNLQPTQKEKDDYLQLSLLSEENWALADKFLHYVSRIDSYEEKIRAVLFKGEFEEQATNFFVKVGEFLVFYDELRRDQFFQAFLEHMLVVGNFLNCKTARGNARAFRIQNIEKTYQLMGQDKETSLFQYILELIFRAQSELFDQPTLTDKPKPVVALSVLCEDYKYFESRCELVSHCILLSEQNPLDNSALYFLPFYMQAREQISLMKKKLEQAAATFKAVKDFYGDKLQSQQMSRFIVDFRTRAMQFKLKRQKRRKQENRVT